MATTKAGEGKATKTDAAPKAAPRGGISQMVTPDAELAKVVGAAPVTRADLTKKVWDYIKKHNLQDATNRRAINADANLKPVFGGKDQVTMFEMTKLVNQHVSK